MENISQMNSYFIIYSLILLMTCNTNPQDSTQSIAIGTEFEIIESHMNDLSDFIISSSELFLEEQFDYEISLLVRNQGWHQILGTYFNTSPDYVSVNDEHRKLFDKQIHTSDKQSIVTLKWKNNISNCSYMFSNLSNISQINFTKFN